MRRCYLHFIGNKTKAQRGLNCPRSHIRLARGRDTLRPDEYSQSPHTWHSTHYLWMKSLGGCVPIKFLFCFFPKQALAPVCGPSLTLSRRHVCANLGVLGGVTVLLLKGVTSLMAQGSASDWDGKASPRGDFSRGFAVFLVSLGHPFLIPEGLCLKPETLWDPSSWKFCPVQLSLRSLLLKVCFVSFLCFLTSISNTPAPPQYFLWWLCCVVWFLSVYQGVRKTAEESSFWKNNVFSGLMKTTSNSAFVAT